MSSLERSLDFYRGLLFPLGWSDSDQIVGERGEPVSYLSAPTEQGTIGLGLREAQTSPLSGAYDRYRVGLHHIAFHVLSRAVVDERARSLRERGATIESGPAEYGYRPGYYAVFFYDPDGLKLELVHRPVRERAGSVLAEGADFVVRDADAADATALVPLLDALGYPTTQERVERRLQRLAKTGNERLLVVDASDGLLGFAGMRIEWPVEHDTPACRLTALIVASRARRRGVGRQLVRVVEHLAQEQGCSQIVLSSGRARDDAHAFYERLGYENTSLVFKKWLDK